MLICLFIFSVFDLIRSQFCVYFVKMSMNNYRKCAKCGRTRIEDLTVTYHRFPNPGSTNITKARAWATYCWPSQDWTSVELLKPLYTTNKVLCGRHFNSTQFYDENRQKLSKFAVPDSIEVEELLDNRENVFNQNEAIKMQTPQSTITQDKTHSAKSSIITSNNHSYVLSAIEVSENEAIKMQTPQSTTTQDKTHSAKSSIITSNNHSYVLSAIEVSENFPEQPAEWMDITTQDSEHHSEIGAPQPVISYVPSLVIHNSIPGTSNDVQITEQYGKLKTKKSKGILRPLGVNKISELTAREKELYNICIKSFREICRLRKRLKSRSKNEKKLHKMKNEIVLLRNRLRNCKKKPKGRVSKTKQLH